MWQRKTCRSHPETTNGPLPLNILSFPLSCLFLSHLRRVRRDIHAIESLSYIQDLGLIYRWFLGSETRACQPGDWRLLLLLPGLLEDTSASAALPLSLSWDSVFQTNLQFRYQSQNVPPGSAGLQHRPPFSHLPLLVPYLRRKHWMIWVREMFCKASQPPFDPNLFCVTEWGWEVGRIYAPYRNQTFFSPGGRKDVEDGIVPVTFSHCNVEKGTTSASSKHALMPNSCWFTCVLNM